MITDDTEASPPAAACSNTLDGTFMLVKGLISPVLALLLVPGAITVDAMRYVDRVMFCTACPGNNPCITATPSWLIRSLLWTCCMSEWSHNYAVMIYAYAYSYLYLHYISYIIMHNRIYTCVSCSGELE